MQLHCSGNACPEYERGSPTLNERQENIGGARDAGSPARNVESAACSAVGVLCVRKAKMRPGCIGWQIGHMQNRRTTDCQTGIPGRARQECCWDACSPCNDGHRGYGSRWVEVTAAEPDRVPSRRESAIASRRPADWRSAAAHQKSSAFLPRAQPLH